MIALILLLGITILAIYWYAMKSIDNTPASIKKLDYEWKKFNEKVKK